MYPVDPEVQEEILRQQNECTFCWATKDHWAVGVLMSYVWRDGRFWLSAATERARVKALRRDNRVSVVVSSVGTKFGPAKGITVKGRCRILTDAATKQWFYPALAAVILPGMEDAQKGFVGMLDSPNRVILEVRPEKYMTFDAVKMMEDSLFPRA